MRSALVELCFGSRRGANGPRFGVSASGWIVPQSPVDLEAAIAFAPVLADIDPRLHAEALDWCIAFANDFVSVTSLRHALAAFDEEHRGAFDRFASIVNVQGATKWPVREPVHLDSFRPSGKSQCRTDHAACVQLRARKVFGINARADILVGLALLPDSPQTQWTHVSLLRNLGYSKRALSEALNDLAGGGMLGTSELRQHHSVRVEETGAFARNPGTAPELTRATVVATLGDRGDDAATSGATGVKERYVAGDRESKMLSSGSGVSSNKDA